MSVSATVSHGGDGSTEISSEAEISIADFDPRIAPPRAAARDGRTTPLERRGGGRRLRGARREGQDGEGWRRRGMVSILLRGWRGGDER
eukprot:3517670-Prymnesium_polylepis.1